MENTQLQENAILSSQHFKKMNKQSSYRFVRKFSPLVKKLLPRSLFLKLKNKFKKGITYKAENKLPFDKNKYPNGINYFGHLKANIGLGQGSRLYGLALHSSDIPSVFIDVALPKKIKQDDPFYNIELSNEPKYNINVFHINPENFYLLEMNYSKDILDYRYNIGVLLWELDKIPDNWLTYLDLFDELWVPSNFIKNILSSVYKKNIFVIPYGMDKKIEATIKKENDEYIFLTMFDSKSNIDRKNPLMAIKAYMSEFREDEKCKLLVKTNNLTKQDYKKLTKLIGDRKDIEIVNKSLSRSDLYDLISSADCLISLHRAEGFGLPLAEAMMLNTLVVATNYSSTTDFVNEKSAYVVDYKLIESNISYQDQKGFKWADPDFEDAKRKLRNAFNHVDAALKLEQSKAIIQNYLSISNSALLMKKRYDDILNLQDISKS